MKVTSHKSHATGFYLLVRKTFCLFLLLSASGIFSSCGNSETDSSVAEGKDSSRISDPANSMKVFLLPAPLQVASVLKLGDVKYSEKILEKTQKSTADYHVAYLKALNLGIYSIDMGYTAVYSDYSNMMKYASKIQGIMNDLNIRSGVKPNTVERIKENTTNKDSLYLIILESYRDAHEYFKTNQREDVGLMILAGAFIEGLYLSSALAKDNQNRELMQLIGQQKTFLQNITFLLKKYPEQKDIQSIIAKMDALSAVFDGIDISYNPSTDRLSNVSISTLQLDQICKRTGNIRNEIIN